MLSIEQTEVIKKQLSSKNANEIVSAIIMGYATSVENISELLSLIPKVADNQLKIKQKRISEYSWATDLLLGERCRYPIQQRKSKNKKEYNPDFPTLLYVCKAHFPNCNSDSGSQADKLFFSEFIQNLKDKNGFDYSSSEDWKWICSTANCRDWILEVIKQNIDDEFVEPKV